MGVWWTECNKPKEALAYMIAGDLQALPKKKYPIVWRFQHSWAIFRVDDVLRIPYYNVCLSADGVCMVFRKKIRTPCFAMRIGSRDMHIWAFDRNGQNLSISTEQSGLNYDKMLQISRRSNYGIYKNDAVTRI